MKQDFYEVANKVRNEFYADWERADGNVALEIRKRAWFGFTKEQDYYVNRIFELIPDDIEMDLPEWYKELDFAEAIYEEVFGHNVLSPWFNELADVSPALRVSGNNVFFEIDGKMKLMPQVINEDVKEQFIKIIGLAGGDFGGLDIMVDSNGDILMKRTCSMLTTCEDMVLQIADTILGNVQYEQFNPDIVKRTTFEDGAFIMHLLDGRRIRVAVTELN